MMPKFRAMSGTATYMSIHAWQGSGSPRTSHKCPYCADEVYEPPFDTDVLLSTRLVIWLCIRLRISILCCLNMC